MTLDRRIDSFIAPVEPNPAPDPTELLADEFVGEPTQVAGLGSAIKGVVQKLTGKAASAVPPTAVPPVPPPAAATMPPAPPVPKPIVPKPLPQPQAVEKILQPPITAQVMKTVEEATEPLTGKPPDELFNWMRTGLPDDANQFIDAAAKAAGVAPPTRVTHKEVLQDLVEMGYKPKDLDWIVNYADNKEQMYKIATAREVLIATAKQTQELARVVEANPSPENAFAYHQATVLLGQVSKGVKNIGTDYARALGIMRATPTGKVEELESILGELGGLDSVVAHAGKLAKLDLDNAANIKRMADMADKSMYSKVKDIWVTTWINGLVSGPVTHAKNILGNEALAVFQAPERFTASLIGAARNADVGERVEMGEAVAMLHGMVAGQIKGLQAAGKGFMENAPVTTGGAKLSESGSMLTNFGDHLGWSGMAGRAANLYGKFVTLPGRTLLAEDEYFKVQGYHMELYAQANRRGAMAREEAIAAGRSPKEANEIGKAETMSVIDNPPEDISAAAWDTARYMTFTDELERGTLGRRLQDLAASNVVARMHAPFVRTPVNIGAAILERTPFAPFTKSFREGMAAGGIPRDMALARVAVGTSMLTTAGYLSSIGRITGAGPGAEKKGERDAQQRSGMTPYSFVFFKGETDAETRELLGKMGRITETNDKVFWSFQGLEPLGGILALGANYADYARYQDNVELVEQVGMGMAFGLSNYMMELPFLQSMSDFVHAITGYGSGEMSPGVVKRMVTNLSKTATSFVIGGSPAGAYSGLQATAERYLNPEASDVRAPPGMAPGLKGVMEAFNRYKSRVPGLSSTLPPKTNRWGEPIEYGEGELHETVSPVRVKEGKQKEVDRVWLDYRLPRADPARDVSWPERRDLGGVTVELTSEQHTELKRLYAWEVRHDGDNVQQALVKITKDKAWGRLSFGDQQAKLMEVDNKFMTVARSLLVNQSRFSPELQAQFEEKKRAVDAYGRYSDEVRH